MPIAMLCPGEGEVTTGVPVTYPLLLVAPFSGGRPPDCHQQVSTNFSTVSQYFHNRRQDIQFRDLIF